MVNSFLYSYFCTPRDHASTYPLLRLLNGGLIHLNSSRYEGGNPEQTALLIKEASRNDAGSYTCELENSIALGKSENDIDVHVWCNITNHNLKIGVFSNI